MNRKRRKLAYIRRKNNFRTRGFVIVMKFSGQLLDQWGSMGKNYLTQQVKRAFNINPEFRGYKEILSPEIELGWDGDDFIRDLVTIRRTGKIVKI